MCKNLEYVCAYKININMKLYEILAQAPMVIAFKGLAHGAEGNGALAQLTQKLNGTILDHTQGVRALELVKKQQPKQLVLIGYSAGAATVMQLNPQLQPVLSILIAAYPTTLNRLEGTIQGSYVNYYQQQELDGILRSKGLPPYKPQGGTPVQINADHNKIVGAVSSDIASRVQSL